MRRNQDASVYNSTISDLLEYCAREGELPKGHYLLEPCDLEVEEDVYTPGPCSTGTTKCGCE